MMRRLCSTLLLSSALLLGGCEVVALGVATPGLIQQKHVNLVNASYAAADTLSTQAGKKFSKSRPLIVSDLQEILDMNQKKVIANPKVGRVLSSQMRDRFMQLGYNVVDSASYGGGNSGEVSGTYEFISGTMYVSLRMTDRSSGKVITLHNYSLPVTYEIKKYMASNANMLPPLF